MNKILAAVLFEVVILISSILQIPLKKAATNEKYTGLRFYINPVVILVYGVFFAVTVATTYLYQYVDMTLATLLYKTEYIFITLFSIFILKEKLNRKKMIGMALILGGVLIYSLV